jgi:hypothetical protein
MVGEPVQIVQVFLGDPENTEPYGGRADLFFQNANGCGFHTGIDRREKVMWPWWRVWDARWVMLDSDVVEAEERRVKAGTN